jgi:hypothetical protein
MAAAFTTAIEARDKQWATAEGHADWLDPEPEIIAQLPELKVRGRPYRTRSRLWRRPPRSYCLPQEISRASVK